MANLNDNTIKQSVIDNAFHERIKNHELYEEFTKVHDCNSEAYDAITDIRYLTDKLSERYDKILELFDEQYGYCGESFSDKEKQELINRKKKFKLESIRMHNISNHCMDEIEIFHRNHGFPVNINNLFDVAVNGNKENYHVEYKISNEFYHVIEFLNDTVRGY